MQSVFAAGLVHLREALIEIVFPVAYCFLFLIDSFGVVGQSSSNQTRNKTKLLAPSGWAAAGGIRSLA